MNGRSDSSGWVRGWIRKPMLLDLASRVGFWAGLATCTVAALAPSVPNSVAQFGDVALHLAAFVYLTLALGIAHHQKRPWKAGAWMIAYGALLEALQAQTAARTAEFADLLVDVVGIAIALALLRGLLPLLRQAGWVVRA